MGHMLGSSCNSCCGEGCPVCQGDTCCGEEYPRVEGECCDGEWRTEEGECCGGEWYPAGTEGECCDDVWRTEEGECCGDTWQTDEGECCGDTWQTDEGECCGDVWYTEEGECCGADQTFVPEVWIPATSELVCCEVYLSFIGTRYIPATEEECGDGEPKCLDQPGGVLYDPPCNQACCEISVACVMTQPEQCAGTPLEENCLSKPCQIACCSEDSDGVVSCEEVPERDCIAPSVVQLGDCATACLGECCIDSELLEFGDDSELLEFGDCEFTAPGGGQFGGAGGGTVQVSLCETEDNCLAAFNGTPDSADYSWTPSDCHPAGVISLGQTTQAECDDLGGCFAGVGSTGCAGLCRAPFSETCCESKESSAAGLTFTQPRRKRCPEFTGTLRVTVTGTTDSAILIHGTPFGENATPTKRCPINHTFLICWDKFNIEPVPCGSNFHNLDVEVCWEEEATQTETLNFSGCNDITVWLGACDRNDCVTTLSYVGSGHTSNAGVVLYGDAVIDASGGGALVLTSNISVSGPCVETLTLTGISTANNEIGGVIQDSPSGLNVQKTGPGTWRMTGASSYEGRLRVLDGTLVVGTTVASSGASPFGTATAAGSLPIIGNAAAGATGTASLLVAGGSNIERGFSVAELGSGASQVVVLGATGAGSAQIGTAGTSIRLGRSAITLQAADTATAVFAGNWLDGSGNANPTVAYTVGAFGNAGVVVFESELSSNATAVNIVNGTAALQQFADDRINPATPVTFETATFDRNGQNQTTNDMTINGTATFIGIGTYTVATTLTGAGNIVNSAGTLTISGANTMTGSVSITGGSVVVNQIVSGPAGKVASATFTDTTLTVAFSADPTSGDEYQLLAGSTVQSYASPVLTTPTPGFTGTYDSATSTLTID